MVWNKSDILAAVYNQVDLTHAQVEEAVDATLDTISLVLASGDNVRLCRFGKFELRERAATTRVNPQNGDRVDVPAKRVVRFSPSPILKERVERA